MIVNRRAVLISALATPFIVKAAALDGLSILVRTPLTRKWPVFVGSVNWWPNLVDHTINVGFGIYRTGIPHEDAIKEAATGRWGMLKGEVAERFLKEAGIERKTLTGGDFLGRIVHTTIADFTQ